jgi:predicted RNase H-like HicB family nuclease
MDIEYTVQIWKEGTQFIAHAMPLDVMSSGKTPEDARKALDEAVRLFLATASDMGTVRDN